MCMAPSSWTFQDNYLPPYLPVIYHIGRRSSKKKKRKKKEKRNEDGGGIKDELALNGMTRWIRYLFMMLCHMHFPGRKCRDLEALLLNRTLLGNRQTSVSAEILSPQPQPVWGSVCCDMGRDRPVCLYWCLVLSVT